ncbi:hypothetical protein FBU30_010044 [Linnemannia zychae]|nr:hypothetical protein FBU30_010044 [Linnemannia zychae]
MAEIIDDTFSTHRLFRHLLIVTDRDGITLPIRFHLVSYNTLDTSLLKKGNTIFVRYAQQHWFLDLSEGLHVEDTAFVYVVPYRLSSILDAHRSLVPNKCKACGKKASQFCAKCKRTFYCTHECQVENWPTHRSTCRILTLTAPVLDLDYTTTKSLFLLKSDDPKN